MAEITLESQPFPVGFHSLHPDRNINFQLNRWITYSGDSTLEDLRRVAPRLVDYPTYQHEFLALASQALAEGRKLPAAYYYRSAEFFMRPGDPARLAARQKFLELVWEYYQLKTTDRLSIPYAVGGARSALPAYRFTPRSPRRTLLVQGGFDSYIEEFFPIIRHLMDAGFDIICFEGPGQGGALVDSGLHLTHEWHLPVKAVLDFFDIKAAALIGISMGSCLALRAAAFEGRIRQVIAYDVFYDWLDATLSKFEPAGRSLVTLLLRLKAARIFNAFFDPMLKQNLLLEWAMQQAKHILGLNSSYEVYRASQKYTTRDISPLVQQDVLLMAGSHDHFIPLEHFYRQVEALQNTRSLTARLFTAQEQAQNHCQVGNISLALRVMVNWIEQTTG